MSTWILDDLQETGDIKEDENGTVQVRRHVVITIHCQVLANDPPTTLDLFTSRSSISYQVGGLWRTNNPPGNGASSQFICVGDGLRPQENPLDYVVRTQVWEWFGPWQVAPVGWSV